MPTCECSESTCNHPAKQCNALAAVEGGYCEPCIAEIFTKALANYHEKSGSPSGATAPTYLKNY